jgi:hypothetical protein
MATTQKEMPWQKSEAYRRFRSTSLVVQTGELGQGVFVQIHFANPAVEIVGEAFTVEDLPNGGFKANGPATYKMSEPYKILEASVEMAPNGAAGLIDALLKQSRNWPDKTKERVAEIVRAWQASQNIPVPPNVKK